MKPSLDYLSFAFFDTLHSDLYQLDNYSQYIDCKAISKAIERRLMTSHSSFAPFASEEIYVQTTEQIQQFASCFNLQAVAENQFQVISDYKKINGFLKDNFLSLSCELQACEFWQQDELEQKMERVMNSFSFIYKPNPIFITFKNGQLVLNLKGSNVLLHEVESFFQIVRTEIEMLDFE